MAQITRSVSVKASPETVWAVIGGFQALPEWHPAAEGSAKEMVDGVEHRRLSLAGGGEILEKALGSDGMSYGYEIVESPLPVKNYRSILSVVGTDQGSVVVWSSTFDPLAETASGVVAGIYEAGLGTLTSRFGS
ncbi:SRPBCC family protein [Hwanghaeella sp.]|uniref:SRPBCC family protein n=1 Tax=Hwanghaeella sp. TaxID=2605943 RepID=UPI003CCB9E88